MYLCFKHKEHTSLINLLHSANDLKEYLNWLFTVKIPHTSYYSYLQLPIHILIKYFRNKIFLVFFLSTKNEKIKT